MQQEALSQLQEEELGYFQRFSRWVQSDQLLGFTLHWEPRGPNMYSIARPHRADIAIGTP